MNKLKSFFLFFIVMLCLTTSCSHSIKIDIARQSSELNHCENIFGEDLNAIKYENSFLLQTGKIDTTDEQTPIPVAIVFIDKKEIILKLVSNHQVANQTNQIYQGDEYRIYLKYKKEIKEHNETIFTGKFLIENKRQKSEYNIVGIICNL